MENVTCILNLWAYLHVFSLPFKRLDCDRHTSIHRAMNSMWYNVNTSWIDGGPLVHPQLSKNQ